MQWAIINAMIQRRYTHNILDRFDYEVKAKQH